MEINIKPLTPDLLEDFLYFFDNIVFQDHPDWSVCYCYSFHFVGTASEWNNKEKNRSEVIKLIKENRMRGYLAYMDNKPIGWCNANDKLNYIRLKLDTFKEIWDNDKQKICSVVCFLIDPAKRGKGVASRLLEQVCIDYKDLGYDYIEAYPQKNSNAEYCQGPPALYKNSGFEMIKEFDEFSMVRKKLKLSILG